jgi:dCTP deaminase
VILNTMEISRRIFDERDEKKRIAIIPRPDRTTFETNSGASIDLHLGRWFRTMRQSNITVLKIGTEKTYSTFSKEHFVPFEKEFILHPSKFALGMTLEWVSFPGDLAGHITGKSSLGRRGLVIETAAGIHPGYAGCLTLELANVGEIPIALVPGMEICQVFFHRTEGENSAASSQFKGSRKPRLGSTI